MHFGEFQVVIWELETMITATNMYSYLDSRNTKENGPKTKKGTFNMMKLHKSRSESMTGIRFTKQVKVVSRCYEKYRMRPFKFYREKCVFKITVYDPLRPQTHKHVGKDTDQ
jgi:hypothetical protein